VTDGFVVTFKVQEESGTLRLTPVWVSRDLSFPMPPVTASGVVFALSAGEFTRQIRVSDGVAALDERPRGLSQATLYALDAATGRIYRYCSELQDLLSRASWMIAGWYAERQGVGLIASVFGAILLFALYRMAPGGTRGRTPVDYWRCEMNLLESVLNAKGGGAISQLASQFGLQENQAASAVQSLIPALAGGLQRNINQGGLEGLLTALTNGNHQRYLEDPSALASSTALDDGNGILGHIFGAKDVSRRVAAQASSRTGISESVLKQMLPAVASLAMGAMSRQAAAASASGNSGLAAGSPDPGSSLLGMLTPLLDRERDGSIMDDLLGSALKLFQK
jgi:hypothetical protein